MVFSAALEKKGDDDDPKAVEKKRFGRRSVQFLEETVQIIALLWSKETTTSGYLLEKKTRRESYFFFLGKNSSRGESKKRLLFYHIIMGNRQKSRRTRKKNVIKNIRWMEKRIEESERKKVGKKRPRIATKEEVKAMCTRGRLDENARKPIQEAVDAFRAEAEKQKIEIGGQKISAKDFAGIIKALCDAKLIPEDAKVLDFPTKQTGESIDATPWIDIFEGETDIATDIPFKNRFANGTTLVYVVECEKEPQIEYLISGRKKGVPRKTDAYHVEEVDGAGSWLWFPSKNCHFHKGAKRTIISLIFLSEEEEEEE